MPAQRAPRDGNDMLFRSGVHVFRRDIRELLPVPRVFSGARGHAVMNVGVDKPWRRKLASAIDLLRAVGHLHVGAVADLFELAVAHDDGGVRERRTTVAVDYGDADDRDRTRPTRALLTSLRRSYGNQRKGRYDLSDTQHEKTSRQ